MTPKRALVREPGCLYPRCISSHPLRHTINIKRARRQHAEYCSILSELGLDVIKLPRDDEHPDSCFVEDNAVVCGGKALICRMAKESRRGEEVAVEEFLSQYMPIKKVEPPATLEGGDVIHLHNRLISGLTERTNTLGVAQMEAWLGVRIETIRDPTIAHLKSYITYLGKGTMIMTKKYSNHPILDHFEKLIVPEKEWYAANTLTIGDVVLMPQGYPRSVRMVKEAGFEVISLNVSEFTKCEGALTCLSILF